MTEVDTNLVQALLNALANQKSAAPSNSLEIIKLILNALALPLAAMTAYLANKANQNAIQAKENANKAVSNTEESKKAISDTAISVEKAHIAINNERSTMVEELKLARENLSKIASENAGLVERLRDVTGPGQIAKEVVSALKADRKE